MCAKAIIDVPYLTWTALRTEVGQIINENGRPNLGRFLFRGQASSSWGLEAQYDRLTVQLDAAKRRSTYEKYLSELRIAFEERAFVELADYHRFRDADEDLPYEVVAQHHGAPTRLLDWSWSPYVAAFFAVSGKAPVGSHDPPVVWALDARGLEHKLGAEQCQVIKVMPTGHARPFAQQGCLTRNKSIYKDLCRLIEAAEEQGLLPDGSPMLYKLTLRLDEIEAVATDLALMGIDRLRMFPGLDSVCQYHRDRLIDELR